MTDRLDIPVHGSYHHPLGPDPIPGGFAVREIKVFEETATVVVGDGAYIFEVPEDCHESQLVKAEAYVTTPSSSGSVQVQLRRLDDGFGGGSDMLTTKITIEPNEVNSKEALAQSEVNVAQAALDWGDHIAIDVDAAGVGARGLGVIVTLAPLHLASIALQGLKGDPGGVTSFTGAWSGSTTYTAGQSVSIAGSSYVAITGSTGVEPGVTPGWETSWMLLVGVPQLTIMTVILDARGYVIEPGEKGDVYFPFPVEIEEVTALARPLGSIVVDLWKDTYANFEPTDADSITGASPITITNAIKTQDTALAGWTTSVAAGDAIRFNVDSCSLIKHLSITLTLRRL